MLPEADGLVLCNECMRTNINELSQPLRISSSSSHIVAGSSSSSSSASAATTAAKRGRKRSAPLRNLSSTSSRASGGRYGPHFSSTSNCSSVSSAPSSSSLSSSLNATSYTNRASKRSRLNPKRECLRVMESTTNLLKFRHPASHFACATFHSPIRADRSIRVSGGLVHSSL